MSAQDKLPWKPRIVRIALAQSAFEAEPSGNLKRALRWIEQAAEMKADIVCLPELFRSPYFCNVEKSPRDYSELMPGEVVPAISRAAGELGIAVVAGSVYERCGEDRYNTSFIVNKRGEVLGTYRKIHIPHDPSFFEGFYFRPGDQGFKVFDLGFAKIGVLICYDQWFPEAARTLALRGAEILFYPTAIGTVQGVAQAEGNWQEAWETVQRGHAVANNVVVAAVNRVGQEGESIFWGGSFISDGFGKVLAKGGSAEQLVVADVDLEHSRFTREGWRFFHSRRPELYGELIKR